jgi:hypothetical protein
LAEQTLNVWGARRDSRYSIVRKVALKLLHRECRKTSDQVRDNTDEPVAELCGKLVPEARR